ncbi:MAG: hypothetical protein K2O71_01640, partial [Lachnospiraceae bacterium]|nr:hypothetical protein [Lachnospiraceae bacterium]
MMQKNQSKPVEKKKNSNFMMAAISLVLAAALMVVDFYLLIHKPSNFIGLLGTTILMIVWIFFFVRSVFLEMDKNKAETDTYLEAIIKSEKAFFLMQRKLEKEIEQIGEYSKVPSEEIITAQKAIAKLTINRSKENTDALMDSNDRVLDKLNSFTALLSEMNEQIREANQESLDDSQQDILANQQDILLNQREAISNIQQIENTLRDEMTKVLDSIHELPSKLPVEAPAANGYSDWNEQENVADEREPQTLYGQQSESADLEIGGMAFADEPEAVGLAEEASDIPYEEQSGSADLE